MLRAETMHFALQQLRRRSYESIAVERLGCFYFHDNGLTVLLLFFVLLHA